MKEIKERKIRKGVKTMSVRKQIIATLIVAFLASSVMAAVPAGYEWWKTANGLYMCFTDGNQNDPWLGTWVRMQNHVDELVANGVKSYDMFACYDGDRSIYYGLGPIDYYLPQTEAGTETEFDSMVAYAHSKGMAVMSWLELGYSSPDHGYWIQAQYDKRDGLSTPYSRSFLWDDSCPKGEWGSSKIADSCYKLIWKQPGFDWASADWQAEAANIVAHWIDKGLDGMVFDAYNLGDYDWGLLNATNATCKPNVQDLWNAAGGFIVPEGIIDGTDSGTAVGPDSDYGFSAVNNVVGGKEKGSWNNDYFDAGSLFVEDGISPEGQFADTVDVARANGGTNYGYDVVRVSDKIRPCSFAIMTTAGVIEELYFSTEYSALCTQAFWDILNVVNSHDALTPMATRVGAPASGSYPAYAHVKTSTDGQSKALCIFNGSAAYANTITVDLSGTGIDVPCETTNLMTGQPGPIITSTNLTVTVEGCGNHGGFLILDVAAAGPVPYATADLPALGDVTGDYTDTHVSDNGYESITEEETTGKPSTRYSVLSHAWSFNIAANSTVQVEAYRTVSPDGDDFVFSYNAGSGWVEMFTLTKTADDNNTQNYVLPGGVSGSIYVRVDDTDQTPGNRDLDTVYVDYIIVD